ncbi:MAG: hypothetical protein HQ546_01030 [Planctomycetes bacterium]|nr:hypothetical protein [Planctomycetota bacterium]
MSQQEINGASPPQGSNVSTGRLSGPTAALILLAGADNRLADHDGNGLRQVWLWLGLAGLAWGLLLAAVWALAAQAFPWWRDTNLPLMPAAAVLTVMALPPLGRVMLAPARLWRGDSPADQAMIAGATMCLFALCLLGILPYHRQAIRLPAFLAWIQPMEEYRVLIVMPMWGVWAMMVPGHFCRPAERASALVRSFIKCQPVAATAMWMAIPLAGTLWQLNFLNGWVALPAALPLVAGSIGSVCICRATGGVTRGALLAGNLLTQLAMLVGYLAGKTHA